MQSVEIVHELDAATVESIIALVARAERADGFRPFSDQAWADLLDPGAASMRYALVRSTAATHAGTLIAVAQATSDGSVWTVESVVVPAQRSDTPPLHRAMLAAISASVSAADGDEVIWLVQDPTPQHDDIAAALDLQVDRRIHQMRRSLPTGHPFAIETRPFDPGRDIDTWVAVNARAFAWNPEQGGWTAHTVRSRMAEPWFDAAGFLIHERDGRMAGFCWTKVHGSTEPPLGEIYVIAVDPDFHGLGIGRQLTEAGLHSLSERGLRVGMLFVDADNAAAVALYTQMGFVISRTDCLYRGRLR